MRIAIPVENSAMNAAVCPSFGRAPFFLIYNTETKHAEFMSNAAANAQGGAGIKAAQVLVDQSVQALLTPHCGQNAADVLHAARINLYKSVPGSAEENITLFVQDKLPALTEIHAGYHGRRPGQ